MTPNPDWFFRQMGYAPARSTQADILRTIGLVAAGVVVGAAAVALLTPKSGPELRSAIGNSAGQLKSKASRMRGAIPAQADALKETLAETADELRNV